MNCKVEKWLTIAALTGWIGSMGTMMVLAVNTPSEDSFSRLELKPTQRVVCIKQAEVRSPISTATQYKGRTESKTLDAVRQQWLSQNQR